MIFFLLLVLVTPAPASNPAAAARMEKKLAAIQEKSTAPAGRRGSPVVFTTEEIDSYFALSMGSRIPKGVSGIHFELHPGKQTGYGVVDFDEYRAGAKRPVNPLLELVLNGRRQVTVVAGFESSGGGRGIYHLESVALDDLVVRGVLLDFLVKWFVLPRYPRAAPDQPFVLPGNIQRAVVEEGRVRVYP